MKVLVVGSGGREHALAWRALQSADVEEVLVAPGNAGTEIEPGLRNVDLNVADADGLVHLAKREAVGLTIVGPEAPLVDGLVDRFQAEGLRCFGPSARSAQLEGSKSFAKAFLARHDIPTAAYEVFTQASPAKAYVAERGAPIVVKADGLAAGKGVVVAQTVAEAHSAIDDMLEANAFGDAGAKVVVEDFLVGEEASFICICDGDTALPFASSQDHKARDDGDKGPNTGGMGAYSPAPVVTPEVHERVMNEVIRPTVEGMKKDGSPYVGFLYAGLMIDPDGAPSVVEFNCRFGDPEAQPVMMRLQSDLVALCNQAVDGTLDRAEIAFDERTALGVVMAAGGYPLDYAKGHPITGLDQADGSVTKVFHAGTSLDGETVVTNGGRVLCVVALGDDVREAQAAAYEGVRKLGWTDAYYRTDIGYRAVARLG